MLAGTEQDGPDGEMQLVDQGGAQILADNGDAAAEADVAGARCSPCQLQSGVDTFRDEAKLRSSVHLEWRPRMMNGGTDRKSTRLNSSHTVNSYAGFCLKKKNQTMKRICR